MSKSLLMIVVTILYAGQCGAYLWSKDYPQAVVLGGYAFANIGFIWSTL